MKTNAFWITPTEEEFIDVKVIVVKVTSEYAFLVTTFQTILSADFSNQYSVVLFLLASSDF